MRSLRHMPLLCLLAPCLALHAQARNPYDLELQQMLAGWSSAGKLEKLVVLDHIQRLRVYVDDRQPIQQELETIRQSSDEDAPVKAEAAACLDDLRAFRLPSQPRILHWYSTPDSRTRVLEEARRAAGSNNAGDLQTLADLEYLAGSAVAADHILQAAHLEPTVPRWLRAAELTDEPLRKFAALQSGLALAPENPQIKLQLAAYYIGRQQLEKARDLLNSAATAAPGNFVIRERRAGLYLNLGLRSAALTELRALEKQWPAPLWLRARMAIDYEQIGLLDEAARLASSVIAENSADREQLELLARFHERRHMKYDLQADYIALSRLEPAQPDIWSRLAQVQIDCGDTAGAKNSLLQLLSLDNGNAEAHRRLARVYEQLRLPAEAHQELAAASGATRPDALKSDAEYLVDPQTLVRTTLAHPPESADLALADIRIQELLSNGLDRVHVQQIYYAGSDAAVDAHRIGSIRYSPATEELRVLRARVWKKDGSVLDAQEFGDHDLAENVSMYYDMRSRQLRYTGLEKGDLIELEYSISSRLRSSAHRGYFGELVLFAGHSPVQLKRYVLLAPASQKVFVHAEKVAPAAVTGKDSAQILVWESRSVPALPREPRSPGITEISPYVHVSTVGDWKQLGSWYADLVRPQFALDPVLEYELQRVTKDARNDREKIAAIQEFVLRSTHYMALEFGIYSYKPYPVSQIYARRFG
ncbi:MAG TPA: DUF3857 domain-containing protein, partial [Candidatus Sulfotelmatobacter sp.]|nr:DUF3857 domain-containing protein [Candidatus Sulfotelmatobacter sp.]